MVKRKESKKIKILFFVLFSIFFLSQSSNAYSQINESDWKETWGRFKKDFPYGAKSNFIFREKFHCPKLLEERDIIRSTITLIRSGKDRGGFVWGDDRSSYTARHGGSGYYFHRTVYEVESHGPKEILITGPLLLQIKTFPKTLRLKYKDSYQELCNNHPMVKDYHRSEFVRYEWYAPNIPFPVLSLKTSDLSLNPDNPPVNFSQLSKDSIYWWESLESMEIIKPEAWEINPPKPEQPRKEIAKKPIPWYAEYFYHWLLLWSVIILGVVFINRGKFVFPLIGGFLGTTIGLVGGFGIIMVAGWALFEILARPSMGASYIGFSFILIPVALLGGVAGAAWGFYFGWRIICRFSRKKGDGNEGTHLGN